jgi:class 3 adenylate cyclase
MIINMPNIDELEASFLIADLAGYTSLTEIHGDLSAVNVVYRYIEIINNCLNPGSKFIERIGDEVLIMSLNPRSLLQTALNLLNAIENEADFPSIHMGLHYGKILIRDRKYFGTTLNLTSRISSHSNGGQILCSGVIVNHIGTQNDFDFKKLGNIRFKNISNPVEVFEVRVKTNGVSLDIDPVCKMQINKEESQSNASYRDKTFYFCSHECLQVFLNKPESYV